MRIQNEKFNRETKILKIITKILKVKNSVINTNNEILIIKPEASMVLH